MSPKVNHWQQWLLIGTGIMLGVMLAAIGAFTPGTARAQGTATPTNQRTTGDIMTAQAATASSQTTNVTATPRENPRPGTRPDPFANLGQAIVVSVALGILLFLVVGVSTSAAP